MIKGDSGMENDVRRQDFPKMARPRALIVLGFLTQMFCRNVC